MFVITFNYPHFDSFLHACGSARDKDGAVSALHRNVETRSFSLSIYKHIDIEFISLNAQMAFFTVHRPSRYKQVCCCSWFPGLLEFADAFFDGRRWETCRLFFGKSCGTPRRTGSHMKMLYFLQKAQIW